MQGQMNSLAFRIKHAWHRGRFFDRCKRALIVRCNKLLYTISPVLLARVRFRLARGHWPNFEQPRTFDEKLLWLVLFWQDPLKTRCADKLGVRSYAEELGLGHLLPKLLRVYEQSDAIDFDGLPSAFVLKATHGSGMNIICRDKNRLNPTVVRRKLDIWLRTDYSAKQGEVFYRQITPRIICEPLLIDQAGEIPKDYKLYCFYGVVHCTLVCSGRDPSDDLDSGVMFDFYDRRWSAKLPYSKSGLQADRRIDKPAAYDEMLAAAEKLSRPFPFVRVDFYSVNGRAILGEMTFTPEAGIDPDNTELAERTLGDLIQLPAKCTTGCASGEF